MALHVHQALRPQLEAEPGLADVYRRIEMPTSAVLARIERTGVLIDSALLAVQSRELAERMLALESEAFELAGQPFNLGSPKQIGEILFGKLGLPVGRKTASGAPSTDEEVLAELAKDYPLPARLLEHRGLSKLKGTYTDKLPLMVNPATGRVHTTYAQAVAVTGRLSSNDPNLQNIPIRTAEGRRVREAFIAPEGASILSADYSQIELRIMAHLSADAGLLHAFGTGIDVHRATAAEVFAGGDLEAVSAEQRRFAKVINFGLIYGMSAFGLAQNLGIERSAATAYIERYFARYPGVKRYMDETRAGAIEQGLGRDPVRPARAPAGDQEAGPAALGRRAAGDQRADAGHGRRPDQAGDDRGAGGDRPRVAGDADDHAGPRRARVRGAGGRDRLGEGGGAAHHGRRRDAGGAARRRCRRRPELGPGALTLRLSRRRQRKVRFEGLPLRVCHPPGRRTARITLPLPRTA